MISEGNETMELAANLSAIAAAEADQNTSAAAADATDSMAGILATSLLLGLMTLITIVGE